MPRFYFDIEDGTSMPDNEGVELTDITQARIETMETEGQSGAGMVRLTLRGKGDLLRVKIDPKLADPAETEMLEDLLVAAHADAKRKLDATMADEMAKVTGGMQLPAGLKLPF